MLEDTFIKNGKVGGAATDIHDGDARFQVFLSHDGCGRGQRLKDKVLGKEVAFFHGPVDIADGVLIAGDNMKISADLDPAVADRVGDILKIIHGELLRDHVDDLVAGRDIGLILVGDELIDLAAGDLFLRILTYDVPTGLETFDMMTRNADIDLAYLEVGIGSIAVIEGHPDGFYRLVYIEHLAVLHPIGVRAS